MGLDWLYQGSFNMTRTVWGKAVSANAYRWQDRDTIVLGGNVPSTSKTNVPTIAQVLGKHSGVRPHVFNDTTYGTTPALSAGQFATMTAGRYVMRLQCDYLANTSYTGLNSGGNAAVAHRTIHWVGARRTNPITSWNYATGVATKGSATSDNFIMDVTGNDDAAVPTLAVPGELCYMIKGIDATTDEYAARTQG